MLSTSNVVFSGFVLVLIAILIVIVAIKARGGSRGGGMLISSEVGSGRIPDRFDDIKSQAADGYIRGRHCTIIKARVIKNQRHVGIRCRIGAKWMRLRKRMQAKEKRERKKLRIKAHAFAESEGCGGECGGIAMQSPEGRTGG